MPTGARREFLRWFDSWVSRRRDGRDRDPLQLWLHHPAATYYQMKYQNTTLEDVLLVMYARKELGLPEIRRRSRLAD
jgi:hypothetical protein